MPLPFEIPNAATHAHAPETLSSTSPACLGAGHEYSYSFPLIFFNVEDFEDAFSSTVIGENEYLRVELRVRLPPSEGSLTGHDRHIVIFQGAVAWDAINSTFQKQTTAKSICTQAALVHGGVGGARLTRTRRASTLTRHQGSAWSTS